MKKSALIPADVFAPREFRSACIAVLLMSAVFFATVLYAPQFMEKILGYSALKAGVGMLPMLGMFAIVVVHRRARFIGRLGPKADDHGRRRRPHRRAVPAVDGRRRLELRRADRRPCA